MGFFDYVSDLYSSLSIQSLEAETADDHKDQDDHKFASGDFNSSKDQQGGVGSAQHSRGATTRGGVSTAVPHSGTDEESDEEKEANKDQVRKPATSDEKGHTPGDGGEGSGQVGADKAGPHGGPVTAAQDDDDEEGGDDEEEEEEDEPEDIQPKLEEGTSMPLHNFPLASSIGTSAALSKRAFGNRRLTPSIALGTDD